MTTYRVQHRYGFLGDYDDETWIVTRLDGARRDYEPHGENVGLVYDCRNAVIYSRLGAIRMAEKLNRQSGDSDRKAMTVMLTSSGKVRKAGETKPIEKKPSDVRIRCYVITDGVLFLTRTGAFVHELGLAATFLERASADRRRASLVRQVGAAFRVKRLERRIS